MAAIELRRVVKAYSAAPGTEHRVLNGVDYRIDAGELVVVLGRSGSGKSTLLNLIGGLDAATSGEIRVGEASLSGLSERQRTLLRRARIGVVFQFFNLIPTLTVAENVRLPLALNGIGAAAQERRAGEALQAVDLAAAGGRYPEELSGGEQQRVAVCRALVHRPSVVLADEPTGNLDLDTAERVLTLLEQLCRQRGATLVMATHSPEVMGRADRVVEIRHGQLVEH